MKSKRVCLCGAAIDDSTLDKFYAQAIELVTHHWSGKHCRVVHGINLINLLWTDGEAHLPCDCGPGRPKAHRTELVADEVNRLMGVYCNEKLAA